MCVFVAQRQIHLIFGYVNGCKGCSLTSASLPCTPSVHMCACLLVTHLSFDYPVHYSLQSLQSVALHDTLEVLGAMHQSLSHANVQVIVGLFSSKILHE